MDEEVNQDENSEVDGMNLEVDSKDEVMHICVNYTCLKIKDLTANRMCPILMYKICYRYVRTFLQAAK